MTAGPFFSVLIPAYNRPEYLSATLASIYQNTESFEVLVSDDNSPRQAEIISLIATYQSYANFRFFAQQTNLGTAGNKNFLVREALGKYLIILGDDDILDPTTLIRLRRIIGRHPEGDIFTFGYRIIDEYSNLVSCRRSPRQIIINNHRYPQWVNRVLPFDIFPFWMVHPGTFCCKSGIERQFGYDPSVGIGDDIMFLFEAINGNKTMIVIPEVLMSWRIIQNYARYGQPNRSLNYANNIISRIKIAYKMRTMQPLVPSIHHQIHSRHFFREFVFAPMKNRAVNSIELVSLLTPEDRIEWKKFSRSLLWVWWNQLGGIRRVIRYVSWFGATSVKQLIAIAINELQYRQKSIQL